MKLRVKFNKFGPVKFIGHLDVMRFFQKAIRRAEIDITYTTGFSPHQVMSFASPLGVGIESNGEYMDIEVNSIVSCEDIRTRLNNASVPGIKVTSVKILPENAGNAMASVAAATYTVRFRKGRELHFSIDERLPDFLARKSIIITKATKKGTREVDLRPGIYDMNWDGEAFHMFICASSSGNIKPIQIITAFAEENGESLMENALLVTREDMFTNISEDQSPEFVSLDDIGELK